MYLLLLTFGVAVAAVAAMTATQVATDQVVRLVLLTLQLTKAMKFFAEWVALAALADQAAMLQAVLPALAL
jgi:hypothetical protein